MSEDPVITVIDARTRDLGGGFVVGRVLPAPHFRALGPFVFLDHMGPVTFPPGRGFDVRPHPHIGLATVTYLFEGEIVHRDSTGALRTITPGAINWMTAGRGVVHSERSTDEGRAAGTTVHGLQLWLALPRTLEETEPSFEHHPADTLPELDLDGVRVRLLAGNAYGITTPVRVSSPLFYAEAVMPAGSSLVLPDEHEERGVYVVDGAVTLDGATYDARKLVVVSPGHVELRADVPSRLAMLGGAPLDGARFIEWNFVSSSSERIEQAKRDWTARKFPARSR